MDDLTPPDPKAMSTIAAGIPPAAAPFWIATGKEVPNNIAVPHSSILLKTINLVSILYWKTECRTYTAEMQMVLYRPSHVSAMTAAGMGVR